MQELSTKTQVEWRRKHVFELSSKGLNQVEIARKLQLHESTISRDLDFIRGKSKENIRKYIEERLPEEYEKCLIGLTAIQKEAWNVAEQTPDIKEKVQALSLLLRREDSKMVETDYGSVLKDEKILSLISNFEPKGTLFPTQFVSIMTNLFVLHPLRPSLISHYSKTGLSAALSSADISCGLPAMESNGIVRSVGIG